MLQDFRSSHRFQFMKKFIFHRVLISKNTACRWRVRCLEIPLRRSRLSRRTVVSILPAISVKFSAARWGVRHMNSRTGSELEAERGFLKKSFSEDIVERNMKFVPVLLSEIITFM